MPCRSPGGSVVLHRLLSAAQGRVGRLAKIADSQVDLVAVVPVELPPPWELPQAAIATYVPEHAHRDCDCS